MRTKRDQMTRPKLEKMFFLENLKVKKVTM